MSHSNLSKLPFIQGDSPPLPCFRLLWASPSLPTFFPGHISPISHPPSPRTLQDSLLPVGKIHRGRGGSIQAWHSAHFLHAWFGLSVSMPSSAAGPDLGFQEDVWPFSSPRGNQAAVNDKLSQCLQPPALLSLHSPLMAGQWGMAIPPKQR